MLSILNLELCGNLKLYNYEQPFQFSLCQGSDSLRIGGDFKSKIENSTLLRNAAICMHVTVTGVTWTQVWLPSAVEWP